MSDATRDGDFVESFLSTLSDMDSAVEALRGSDWAFVVYRRDDDHGSYGVGVMNGEDLVFSQVALRELEDYFIAERWDEEAGDGPEDEDA